MLYYIPYLYYILYNGILLDISLCVLMLCALSFRNCLNNSRLNIVTISQCCQIGLIRWESIGYDFSVEIDPRGALWMDPPCKARTLATLPKGGIFDYWYARPTCIYYFIARSLANFSPLPTPMKCRMQLQAT